MALVHTTAPSFFNTFLLYTAAVIPHQPAFPKCFPCRVLAYIKSLQGLRLITAIASRRFSHRLPSPPIASLEHFLGAFP